MWAGIDVGAGRKGFHAALVGDRRLLAGPTRLATVRETVHWLLSYAPQLVAVDSPRSAAPDNSRSRPEERVLAAQVCGIRYTPERALIERNPYYGWIANGFELYAALEEAGLEAIECFPTASWTRWAGPKGAVTRAAWSREALARLGLEDAPSRLGQDGRDAIAAALTARSYAHGSTESFGEIVVPTRTRATAGRS